MLTRANYTIFNAGLHYSPAGGLDYAKELERAMSAIDRANKRGTKIAWLDSFRPHFPSLGGSYTAYLEGRRGNNLSANSMCAPLDAKEDDVGYWNYQSLLAIKNFPHIYHIHTTDITHDRYDMHLGPLTWYNSSKLDCVHQCMQPCFWEAILWRIGETLMKMVLPSQRPC